MIKFGDLKVGDLVLVDDEGVEREGMVTDKSRDDSMVCIDAGVQEFWFSAGNLRPIPLNEAWLLRLGFLRQETEGGGIKYLKGPFRVLTSRPDDFGRLEVWYREDHRLFTQPLFVHELQHHYLEMTKVPLERAPTL